MSDGEGFDDFFNEFLSGGSRDIPEPTPEDVRMEAMTATELHMTAFYAGVETNQGNWKDMLHDWYDEFKHYLPILEDFEEYEQCAKVFKCQREIREIMLNDKLNKDLKKLEVTTVYEVEPEEPEDDGELDF